MNCKNVVLEEVNTREKTPDGKSHRRRYKTKPYHTIKVRSMVKQHPGDDETPSTSPDKNLAVSHIRRGHFKDFTHGPGLFGRHHGLYWWDVAVVCKKDKDAPPAKKDYDVYPE